MAKPPARAVQSEWRTVLLMQCRFVSALEGWKVVYLRSLLEFMHRIYE